MPDIAFRPLVEDDLALLFQWLGRPHVRKWYSPQPSSYMEVVAKYGPRTLPGSAVDSFVIRVDGADAGYIQKYRLERFPEYRRLLGLEHEGGIAGMDLFLGEAWLCGRGLGSLAIRRFFDELVMGEPDIHACVAGVHEGNAASIRAFEKAGFRPGGIAVNERGERERIMRRDREAGAFRIAPIDLAHAATCARLRREMYLASFGSAEGLEEEMGEGDQAYLGQLRAKIAQLPEGNVHLWRDGAIVGQLEMRLLDDEPEVAYLSLIHVSAGLRGQGLGQRLHAHAMQVARSRGKRLMRLSVSERNAAALRFYRRLGWVVAGTRPGRTPMVVMEAPVR